MYATIITNTSVIVNFYELNITEFRRIFLGVSDLKTISMQSTLPELGMDSMTAVEVKQLLEREFDFFLTTQDVRAMTFAKLQELAGGKKLTTSEKSAAEANIENMVQRIGEEATFQKLVIKLPSLEHEENYPTVFMVPGIEGAAASMKILAQGLHASVLCLQHCGVYNSYSPTSIAERLLPVR